MALAHYLFQDYKEKIKNGNNKVKLPTLRDILKCATELRDLQDNEKAYNEFKFLKIFLNSFMQH